MNGAELDRDALERRLERSVRRDLRLYAGYTEADLRGVTLERLLRIRKRVLNDLISTPPRHHVA